LDGRVEKRREIVACLDRSLDLDQLDHDNPLLLEERALEAQRVVVNVQHTERGQEDVWGIVFDRACEPILFILF